MAQKQITVAYIGMDPNDGTQPQNKNIELARYYTHIESNISLKDTVISYDADSIVSSHHGWVEWDHGVSKTDTKGKWGYSDLIFVLPHPRLFSFNTAGLQKADVDQRIGNIADAMLLSWLRNDELLDSMLQYTFFFLPHEEPVNEFQLSVWEKMFGRFTEIKRSSQITATEPGKIAPLVSTFVNRFKQFRSSSPIWVPEDPMPMLFETWKRYRGFDTVAHFEDDVIIKDLSTTSSGKPIGADIALNDNHLVILPYMSPLSDFVGEIIKEYAFRIDSSVKNIKKKRFFNVSMSHSDESRQPYELIDEGNLWSLTFNGITKSIQPYEGLIYIAMFLKNPTKEYQLKELDSDLPSHTISYEENSEDDNSDDEEDNRTEITSESKRIDKDSACSQDDVERMKKEMMRLVDEIKEIDDPSEKTKKENEIKKYRDFYYSKVNPRGGVNSQGQSIAQPRRVHSPEEMTSHKRIDRATRFAITKMLKKDFPEAGAHFKKYISLKFNNYSYTPPYLTWKVRIQRKAKQRKSTKRRMSNIEKIQVSKLVSKIMRGDYKCDPSSAYKYMATVISPLWQGKNFTKYFEPPPKTVLKTYHYSNKSIKKVVSMVSKVVDAKTTVSKEEKYLWSLFCKELHIKINRNENAEEI